MTANKAKSNDIKHRLRKDHQMTLTDFADKYGFKFRDVSDVVRGIRLGQYGIGRDISEKLQALTGLKITQ